MSNDVCGYIVSSLDHEVQITLENYINKSEIGITKIHKNQLFNFPLDMLPDDDNFIFLIGDRPGYPNATYLIDYEEYDPESSNIGFPADPRKRLNILLNTLIDMIKITHAEKMVVALTDSNQIETRKQVALSDFHKVIHDDFKEYQAPPDTLYEIICRSSDLA